MNILISTILSTKHKVGVTQYLIGLIKYLQKIDNTNKYFVVTSTDNYKFFNFTSFNFHEIRVNIKEKNRLQLRFKYFIWYLFTLPKLAKKNHIDLIHEPCAWFINKKIKTIVTIHDLIELKTQKYNNLISYIKKRMIISSIKNSKKIIAVSNSTQRDIENSFRKESNLIYNGIDKNEFINPCFIETLVKYDVQEKGYFIFVGTIQKHKNLLNLLEAFAILPPTFESYKLVLVGKPDNAQKELKKLIDKLSLEKKIIFTTHVSEAEKITLIKKSKALLLVSNYEGFGFPILEAQSLGVPVIVSNNSSLPEIAGEAALFVNQNDSKDIAKKMEQLLNNIALCDTLIIKGLKNIERFSWEDCARKTLSLYSSTMN